MIYIFSYPNLFSIFFFSLLSTLCTLLSPPDIPTESSTQDHHPNQSHPQNATQLSCKIVPKVPEVLTPSVNEPEIKIPTAKDTVEGEASVAVKAPQYCYNIEILESERGEDGVNHSVDGSQNVRTAHHPVSSHGLLRHHPSIVSCHIRIPMCVCVCLHVCLSLCVCLDVSLSVCLSVCASISLPHNTKDTYSQYLLPHTVRTCRCYKPRLPVDCSSRRAVKR